MKARLIAVAACSLLMTQAVQSAEIRMLAEALLQIAIVLISVSIVATLPWLAIVGGIVGAAGGLLMVNGYTLAVEIPFLAA
jgi:hypothetical protein